MKTIYNFNTTVNSKEWMELLRFLVPYTPFFSIIIRKDLKLLPGGKKLIKMLNNYLISEKEVSEWPGTKLYGSTAKQYIYNYNVNLSTILHKYSLSPYDWIQPKLPEDLSFLRKDKTAFFVTIAHERDCYFELDEKDILIEGIKYWLK